MRIAIVTETFLPKWDGVATTLCHLLDHLDERGHTSLMFAPQGAPEQYARTPIVGLPSVRFPLYPDLRLVPPTVDVTQRLAAFSPDVVHLVNPASLGWVGLSGARKLGVPVVASYHTDLPGYTRLYHLSWLNNTIWAYFRWLHNQADLNLCPSNFTKAELEAQGFRRVATWPHGVDTHKFAPRHRTAEWRSRLTDGHPDTFVMLYVGRLATEKRVEWLRPVMDVLPHARLAIVGDGPKRQELEKRFAGTNAVFTGYLKGQDLSSAYASADLFAFPSANETFGNVVLEAMASGLPVVSVRSGGPVDLVQDGSTGFLCDPDDPADFVARVWRCSSDDQAMRRMSQTARAYALKQRWDVVLDDLCEHYTQLIERKPKPVSDHRPIVRTLPQRAHLFRSQLANLWESQHRS